jgi:hypothetical protein
MNRKPTYACIAALLLAGMAQTLPAQTEGSAAFTVTTLPTGKGFDPTNLVAIWVTDSKNNFVKTLELCADSRQTYLTKWTKASKGNTAGAVVRPVLPVHQKHAVTWDCRNAAGALVADGTYRVMVEMTTRTKSGPATSSKYIQFAKGPAPVAVTPADLANFAGISLVYAPLVPHDVAVTRITPPTGLAGATIPVLISVSNRQVQAESFAVVLSNQTAGVRIGSASVSALAGRSATTVSIAWNTAGLAAGSQTLRAVAGPVAGETNTADNTLTAVLTLTNTAAGSARHDAAVVAVAAEDEATPGDIVRVHVTVANLGQTTDTFSVALADNTAAQALGSLAVTNLAAGARADLIFAWPTLGATAGDHTLLATASLAGDAYAANNTGSGTGRVAASGIRAVPLGAAGGLGGYCAAIARGESNLVVAGLGATLTVLADNGTGGFTRVGSLHLPGMIQSVVVSGASAYTANGPAGVHVVDLSNPAAPQYRMTFDSSRHATALALQGNLLLVADGSAGLRILNVAVPAAPVLVGSYRTEGPARGVAVSGTTAYVVDSFVGLHVLDIATPAAPRLLGMLKTGFGAAVAVSGSYAYLTDGAGKFRVVNIANPAAPVTAGVLQLPAPGNGVTVSGSLAYVPAGTAGLLVVNVATPAAPALLGSVDTPGQACAFAPGAPRAYVADGFLGVRAVTVTTPAAPALAGAYDGGHRVVDVAVADGRAYVAAGESGLCIYDVSRVAAPVLLGRSTVPANARGVAVSGTLACIADGPYGVKLLNVANPAAPASVGAYAPPAGVGAIRCVALAGTTLLAADAHQILRLDVTTPAAPQLKASCTISGYVHDLSISNTLAAVAAGTGGLQLFDISGTSQLALRGRYDTPGLAAGARLVGSTAYVADGRAGWLIVNVANPAAPVLVNAYSTRAFAVAMDGTRAAVAGGGEVSILDAATPLTPVAVGMVGPLVNALRTAAAGGYAYVSEDEEGAAVVALTANAGVPLVGVAVSKATTEDTLAAAATPATTTAAAPGSAGGTAPAPTAAPPGPPARPTFAMAAPVSLAASGAGFVVRWNSVAGQTYTVLKSTDLATGFTPIAAGIPATAPVNSYTDAVTSAAAFYLVQVDAP